MRQLPEGLRAELDRMLTEGKMGLVEITDYLRGKGADVSKSAVGRYSQSFEEVARDIRDSRMMAKALAKEIGEDDDENVGALVVASLEGFLLRAQRQIVDAKGEVDTEKLASMAECIRNLQTAWKTNVDARLKIRAAVAKEAASVVEKIAGERGVGADTLEAIKQGVLGIGKRTAA